MPNRIARTVYGISYPCSLRITRFLCVAAHDLDFVRLNSSLIIQLEVHVLDQKSPHVVAEPISVKMTLQE